MKKIIFLLCVFALFMASCASTSGDSSGRAGGQIPVEIKVLVFFADGSLDEYTISDYDDALVFIQRQARFTASGALLETVEYTYNESNG